MDARKPSLCSFQTAIGCDYINTATGCYNL